MTLPLLGKNETLRQRYSEKSGAFKLLLWMITIKPFINTLVGLDLLGISVSLLQIFGVFIVLVLIWGLISNKPQSIRNKPSVTYTLFFIIYAFNLILVIVFNPDLGTIRDFLKVMTIPLMFYLYYRTINDDLDLELIFHAFLISTIPLALIFMYDSFIIGTYQETRGLDRLDTSFGDITNFGLQVNSAFIIILFSLLKVNKPSKALLIKVVTIVIFGLYILIAIAHGASFGVFVTTLSIFAFFYFRKNFFLLVLISAILIVPAYFIFADWFSVFFANFFGRELEAINTGQSLDDGQFFHGRMSRWQRLFELFEDQNLFDQVFGGLAVSYPFMIGTGPHNDFLRVTFSAGYLGLIFYLLFLGQLFFKSILMHAKSLRFLGLATLANLFIYSITTTPSVYIDYNFFVMAVFVYLAKYVPFKSSHA